MKRLGGSIFAALVLASLVARANSPEDELESRVRAAIESSQEVRDEGVAVAVVKGGRTLLLKGYGYRDRQRKLPVTEKTVFVLGSLSKAFTSLSLLMEAEQGKVSLDHPVKKVLSDFKLADKDATAQATLADVLSHRTGMPRHDAFWYLAPWDRHGLLSRLRYLPWGKLGFRRGYQYNNLMYGVAGLALEKSSGTSWENFVSERVLKPVGMSDASVTLRAMSASTETALGYAREERLPYKDVSNIAGAAGVNASARDMSKWLGFWLAGGVTEEGKRLVSQESVHSIFQARVTLSAHLAYGLGWYVDDSTSERIYHHTGSMDGFLSEIALVPGRDAGVIVLTNQNDTKVIGKVVKAALASIAGIDFDDGLSSDPSGSDDGAPLRALQAPASWAGKYDNDAYGTMQVSVSGGDATVSYNGREWPIRSKGGKPAITVDFGGRTEDLVLDGMGSKSFSIRFEDKTDAFAFKKQGRFFFWSDAFTDPSFELPAFAPGF